MAKKDYTSWSKKELVEEIERLGKQKKYGLVWEDKPEDVVEQCKNELPVLEEVKSKAISTDPDKPVNLLIEGDNYHALSVLNYTHKGKIDVIYIDPPYNTGAKNWKYNNDYVDKDDEYRHSKWISLLSRRLKLAKKILKRNGALICAIDENEHGHLDVLIEEIFYNFDRHSIAIIHNPKGVQGKNFSYTHEYALFVIPKNKKTIIERELADDEIYISNFRNWGGESLREDAKNCFYPIIIKGNKVIGFGDVLEENIHPEASNIIQPDGSIHIWPIDNGGVERKWRYARQSVEQIQEVLRVKYVKGTAQVNIAKNYGTYKTVWMDKKYDAGEYGTKLLKSILPKNDFDFPKSLWTVYECLYAVVGKKQDAIVLDFFAGSGTTAHATMMLNETDEGNRSFIVSTNNENRIAEDVCYPRIKKVIEGYKYKGVDKILLYEKKLSERALKDADLILEKLDGIREESQDDYDNIQVKVEDNYLRLYGIKKCLSRKEGYGGNLKYYKTTFVPAKPTDRNRTKLTKKATEMLCIREDTFDEVKSDEAYKIYRNKKQCTGILFDHQAMDTFKGEIRSVKDRFSVYVFSLGDDTFEEEFAEFGNRVTLSPIPEAILRVYRRIFK